MSATETPIEKVEAEIYDIFGVVIFIIITILSSYLTISTIRSIWFPPDIEDDEPEKESSPPPTSQNSQNTDTSYKNPTQQPQQTAQSGYKSGSQTPGSTTPQPTRTDAAFPATPPVPNNPSATTGTTNHLSLDLVNNSSNQPSKSENDSKESKESDENNKSRTSKIDSKNKSKFSIGSGSSSNRANSAKKGTKSKSGSKSRSSRKSTSPGAENSYSSQKMSIFTLTSLTLCSVSFLVGFLKVTITGFNDADGMYLKQNPYSMNKLSLLYNILKFRNGVIWSKCWIFLLFISSIWNIMDTYL